MNMRMEDSVFEAIRCSSTATQREPGVAYTCGDPTGRRSLPGICTEYRFVRNDLQALGGRSDPKMRMLDLGWAEGGVGGKGVKGTETLLDDHRDA